MASDACSGSFIVKNGQVRLPGPVFIPGVVEDVALPVPPPRRRPSRRAQFVWNGNQFMIA